MNKPRNGRVKIYLDQVTPEEAMDLIDKCKAYILDPIHQKHSLENGVYVDQSIAAGAIYDDFEIEKQWHCSQNLQGV